MVRHKNRYIVVEIVELNKNDKDVLILRPASLHTAILQKVFMLHGDFGVAAIRAGFNAKYCNEKTRIALIRTRHGPHKLVASSLPFINSIENKAASLNTLYTGATIRQCFKYLMKYQQRKFDEYCVNLKTIEEKNALKEIMLNYDKVLEIT